MVRPCCRAAQRGIWELLCSGRGCRAGGLPNTVLWRPPSRECEVAVRTLHLSRHARGGLSCERVIWQHGLSHLAGIRSAVRHAPGMVVLGRRWG